MFVSRSSSHWTHTLNHFLVDSLCCLVGFWAGAALRFDEVLPAKVWSYLPTLIVAALVLPACCYSLGLYAPAERKRLFRERFVHVMLALGLMMMAVLAMGSLYFDSRIGRGVQFYGVGITSCLVFIHHFILSHRFVANPERCVLVMSTSLDEEMACSLDRVHVRQGDFLGAFVVKDGLLPSRLKPLGSICDIERTTAELKATRILCREDHLLDPGIARALRVLRYHGVRITTLTQAYEEAHQMVPLELVTDLWMLNASAHPQMLYIQKLKRSFDIIACLLLMLVLGPVCLIGMLLVWLTDGSPIFYRQVRSGRLGKPFEVLKLRTMRRDAEAGGAQWSAVKGDSRVTKVGNFLRKFRIDEIPQLINVLRGEMSFVGPRPERPEFIEQIEREVPFFSERLLLPPGLTGWAQVNYPYGASLDDARRKLEYDLYYLKHMGLLLDLFVLLDTVKTVVRGGAKVRTPVRSMLAEQVAKPDPAVS